MDRRNDALDEDPQPVEPMETEDTMQVMETQKNSVTAEVVRDAQASPIIGSNPFSHHSQPSDNSFMKQVSLNDTNKMTDSDFSFNDESSALDQSLKDSSKSLQGLFSSNNVKRLKRLDYLDYVFTSNKDNFLPHMIRDNLRSEYDRLASETGEGWRDELKLVRLEESKETDLSGTKRREWVREDHYRHEKSDSFLTDSFESEDRGEANGEDEDFEECGENNGENNEEEDEWLDEEIEMDFDIDMQDSFQQEEEGGIRITKMDMEGEFLKRKREDEMNSKKKRKVARRRSRSELKRDLIRWSSVLNILTARYKVLVNTVICDEIHALLVSVNGFSKQKSISSIVKWVNSNLASLLQFKSGLTIDCSDEEFKFLMLFAALHFCKSVPFSRLVVRLDPIPYNNTFGIKKKVVYIDCDEPPLKKAKNSSDAFPVENLRVEAYDGGEWKTIYQNAKCLALKKSVKPMKEKVEFPIFVVGMFPDITVDISEKFLHLVPAKDTAIVKTNFDYISKWFKKHICPPDEIKSLANQELRSILEKERSAMDSIADANLREIPKSQGALKNHPLYVLEKFISRYYAIYPKDTPPVAMHGEIPIFYRSNLRLLHTKDRWLSDYCLEVLPEEIEKPYKIVKSLVSSKRGMTHLFGRWQTRPYIAPTAENGIVPKNERGQVDLWNPGMLPKGCVHLSNMPYISSVCKKLGIDYAPCMVGFEIKHYRNVPKVDGVIVCEEFEETLKEAYVNYMELRAQKREEKRQARISENWRKLFRGLLARRKASLLFEKCAQDEKEFESSPSKASSEGINAEGRTSEENINSMLDDEDEKIKLSDDTKQSSEMEDISPAKAEVHKKGTTESQIVENENVLDDDAPKEEKSSNQNQNPDSDEDVIIVSKVITRSVARKLREKGKTSHMQSSGEPIIHILD